jgi:hypothetical protein
VRAPRRRTAARAAIRAIVLFGLARGCTCAGASETPPGDAGRGGAGGTLDAGSTTTTWYQSTSITSPTTTPAGGGGAGGSAASGGAGGAAPSEPCPGWAGWVRWKDFAGDCSLCVPASKDALPQPIEWVPCNPKSGFDKGCRQMKVDWTIDQTGFAYTAAVDIRPDGSAMLDIVRLSGIGPKPYRMNVIAEADGPVHSALLDPRGEGIQGCTFDLETVVGMAQGNVALNIMDDPNGGDPYPEAAIGGSIDLLHPGVLYSWNPSHGHGFAASDVVWASYDSYDVGVARWGQPWKVVSKSMDVGGLQQVNLKVWHDFVTWQASDGVYMGTMAWTPAKGAYPFITFPGDWSRAANGLGTDGVDLVWFYGEGKAQPLDYQYPKTSVMTSPFTKDPVALKPRRLRSFTDSQPPVSQWTVGCGYAAVEGAANHPLVVRLSDGWSWVLEPEPLGDGGPKQQWRFSTVYGINCDEVFVQGGVGVEMQIARVRLDALGPGMPPD